MKIEFIFEEDKEIIISMNTLMYFHDQLMIENQSQVFMKIITREADNNIKLKKFTKIES